MNNKMIIAVIVGVVFGAGGFAGGIYYQKSKTPTFNRQFGARGMNRNGFRPVSGEIISSDDKSVTVKMSDDSSKIVLVSDKTQINKADLATRAELIVGQKIVVFGQENSDGSVIAQSIQLNPVQRGMMGTGDVKTIKIEAGSYYYKPAEIRVKLSDKVKIELTAVDMMHDFNIDELGVNVPVTKSGNTNSAEFVASKTGTFEYYCSVGQHRKRGQVGKIIVEP